MQWSEQNIGAHARKLIDWNEKETLPQRSVSIEGAVDEDGSIFYS